MKEIKITVNEFRHIKSGETIANGYSNGYCTAPKEEGFYTLYEVADENNNHIRWEWEKEMAWSRKNTIELANEIVSKLDLSQMFFINKEGFKEIWRMIERFRRENNYPNEMNAKVDDGFLYINDKKVERIAPKIAMLVPKKSFDDAKADYYENKILARQEG